MHELARLVEWLLTPGTLQLFIKEYRKLGAAYTLEPETQYRINHFINLFSCNQLPDAVFIRCVRQTINQYLESVKYA